MTKRFRNFIRQLILITTFIACKIHVFGTGIFPQDGSQLTTIHVMFEFTDILGADYYQLTIFQGSEFSNKPVVSIGTRNLSIQIKKGLQFGNNYQWQYKAFKKSKPVFESPVFNFSILQSPVIDTAFTRQEVLATTKQDEALILIDRNAIAIDKNGKPVWFLPLPTDSLSKWIIRDVNLSPSGTITYLDVNGAYEKKLDGALVWKGPNDGKISGKTKEEYHHQFQKMADGSFIVCGSTYTNDGPAPVAESVRFNTIIWYNPDSTVRWNWNELYSLTNDSLFRQSRKKNSASHLNGFALTPDNSRMFLSFKNLSDVFVLNMKTGSFEASIKKNFFGSKADFNQQHGPFFISPDELLIYNNNIKEDKEKEDTGRVTPSVMLFRYDTLHKKFSLVWNYYIYSQKYPEGIAGKEGYVSKLTNGNLLVCTGGANYAAELTPKGIKKWECYFYKRSKNDTTWKPYSNYRCRSVASLYPLYFTLQYTGIKNSYYIFRLHNAGSTAAAYTLRFTAAGNEKPIFFKSVFLQPDGSQLFFIPENWVKKALACSIEPVGIKTTPKVYEYKIIR